MIILLIFKSFSWETHCHSADSDFISEPLSTCMQIKHVGLSENEITDSN